MSTTRGRIDDSYSAIPGLAYSITREGLKREDPRSLLKTRLRRVADY